MSYLRFVSRVRPEVSSDCIDEFWDFTDPTDADDFTGGRWRPAAGVDGTPGTYGFVSGESGQVAGTKNVLSTRTFPVSPGAPATASFYHRLYVYPQDFADGWTCEGLLEFLDGSDNVLSFASDSVPIGEADNDFHEMSLGPAVAPAGSTSMRLRVVFTVGKDYSSVYVFEIDNVALSSCP